MPIDGPNYQWPSGTPYIVADRGTMALGVKDVSPFIPDTLTGTENFETDPISGSGTWTLTASSPHTGLRCLRSAVIGNNASTDYSFTVPVGTNFIKFWHRVSSELNFDFFQVYKDVAGVPANLLFQLSGTANIWQQQQLTITGVTTLIFRYIKDGSSAVGLDAAFIDDIEWVGTLGQAAVQNYEPFHLDTNNCVKVNLCDNTVVVDGIVETRFLDCITDSVTICPGDDPINVIVDNFPSQTPLDCATDSVTICPGDDPINVVVENFPAVAHLDCATDSVTICPGDDPIEVTVNNFPAVAHLDCATDSVTICPGDDPIEVTVNNFPSQTPLDCATDSVTVCPGDDPLEVVVNNFPAHVPSDCATDSVTVCPGDDPLEVVVNNFPAVAHLDCATDSVTVCIDEPLDVNITNEPLDVNVLGSVTLVPGRRSLRGIYYVGTGPQAYTTGADTATGGDFWIVNTSNTIVVYIRTVKFTVMLSALALLTQLPTIRMERMTFTGTPSGAQITPAKRDSNDFANTGTMRTANTGMTITAGAAIQSFAPPAADVIGGLLAVNATAAVPVEQIFAPNDIDGFITLRQNEGIVFRQNTAGSATENRQYWLNVAWEEI